jgi:hypothetical protein
MFMKRIFCYLIQCFFLKPVTFTAEKLIIGCTAIEKPISE